MPQDATWDLLYGDGTSTLRNLTLKVRWDMNPPPAMMNLLARTKEVMKKGFAQQWELHVTIASFGPLEHGKSYMIMNSCMLSLQVQSHFGGTCYIYHNQGAKNNKFDSRSEFSTMDA